MSFKSKTILSLFFLSFLCFFIPNQVFADFNLTVTPREGGGNLNFGKTTVSSPPSREVEIRITATGGNQYQLYQRVIQPLTSSKGETLNPEVITSFTYRGSNNSGTLYQEQELPLSYADQLLYTSSPNGDSDSFQMIFTVNRDALEASGSFFGKILYTLQPLGGGSQVTIYLNVYVDASGDLKVEFDTSYSQNHLKLTTENEKEHEGYISLSFINNPGEKIKIYQKIVDLPKDDLNREIDEGVIDFYLSGDTKGELYCKNPQALEIDKVLIYSSNQSEDNFFINFIFNKDNINTQSAGIYRGQINYLIEGTEVPKKFSLEFEIEVIPVFELEVETPPGGMIFPNLSPGDLPTVKEIILKVNTNMKKPYIVNQTLSSAVVSEEGKQISSDLFTMKAVLFEEYPGNVKITNFRSVPVGDIALFFSDDQGSQVKFKVTYKLQADYSILPGKYSAMVTYSLEQR